MLNFSIGQKRNPIAANQLLDILLKMNLSGTLFMGYPVLVDIDNKLIVDALLITLEHGLIIIDFSDNAGTSDDIENIRQKQLDLYRYMEIKLKSYKNLMDGRELALPIKTISLIPGCNKSIIEYDFIISDPNLLIDVINSFPSISHDIYININSAIERVSNVRPLRKRTNVKKPNSYGAVMKNIEKEIYNLDKWQNNAAIETPDGIQRIRGLAGSGKTIVLALKAAYLHVLHEDWDIALTFQTRSLYQQFHELVRRFTWDQIHDEPNWDKLKIIHAWGGSTQRGFYSEVSKYQGITPKDFGYGKNKSSSILAFDTVCKELISQISEDQFQPIFDAILIDEAQDFRQSFFELSYLAAKSPKRIIYAYDEMQNLSNFMMLSPSEMFGKDKGGNIRVPDLKNIKGSASQDIVLPVCYRNTPWALALAHGLGFGIYRDDGLIQYFNDPKGLWEEVGYEIVSGKLSTHNQVSLRRKADSFPAYITQLIDSSESITCKCFSDKKKQAEFVAQEIKKDLFERELEYRDILIILPDPINAKEEAIPIITELSKLDIPAHIAGVTSSRDELFNDDAVAISNIYRAKGNEAPIVYILNSEYCYEGTELNKRRNILFTAITRSKGWVRIYGSGPSMNLLIKEINKTIMSDFSLTFNVPNQEEINRMRKLYGDISHKDKLKYQKAQEELTSIIEQIEQGNLLLDNLPRELREKLTALLIGNDNNVQP